MSKEYPDPGPEPVKASPAERAAYWKAKELHDTEGFRHLKPNPVGVDATDVRLKQLRLEHSKFLDLHSPMKAAIWLALLRPEKDIIHDAEMSRRFAESQRLGRDIQEHIPPDRPSIIGIAQRLVASALAGDVTAIDRIADRIEGKAGLRIGDESEDNPEKRKQATDITERVIQRLTRQRIEGVTPGDTSKVIDVVATTIQNKEKDDARVVDH